MWSDERGAVLAEWALLVVLVAIVALVALTFVGQETLRLWEAIS